MRDARLRHPGGGAGRSLRCAIYTRKSTDEGLDQEFNSLDAQREACASYILSQRHEGWSLHPTVYDDGGFSGGTIDRPGLQRLLAEVKAGRVDVIVVYKVDRLTRSLADFAKIVDVLDAAGASFVSITQAFNTTTSMGRLTLNVLLSFAQFEREVISERVRDKIAASKAKGMWMGGPVPLGYRVRERKLIVDEPEADTVRTIMHRYLELGTVPLLLDHLRESGIVTKVQTLKDGSKRGGIPFTRGPLYHLLKNRIYLGMIVHKGTAYAGEHAGIVEQEVFDAVQDRLAATAGDRHRRPRSAHSSLLTGMIRDERGRPMSPSHAVKAGKRYRYYESRTSSSCVPSAVNEKRTRLPAGDLERAIRKALFAFLGDGARLVQLTSNRPVEESCRFVEWCRARATALGDAPITEARAFLLAVDFRVVASTMAVQSSLDVDRLRARAHIMMSRDANSCERVDLEIESHRVRYGQELRLRVEAAPVIARMRNERLVGLVVKAFAARDQLIVIAPDEATASNTTTRHLQRLARLAYLAPDIITTILAGDQPTRIGSRDLAKIASLPLCWTEQRRMLGFA